jgi:hypothetical protein
MVSRDTLLDQEYPFPFEAMKALVRKAGAPPVERCKRRTPYASLGKHRTIRLEV